MGRLIGPYHVIDLPAVRRETPIILDRIYWWKHTVYGLLEVDVTVAFDHDVVDGAPAARFVQRLVELIESGYGLAEEQTVLENSER